MSVFKTNGWTIEVHQEALDVTPAREPDPEWLYLDTAGHEHRYTDPESGDFSVLTLEEVSLGEWWCEFCADLHEDFESRCRLCGERINPGFRSPSGRQFMAGLREALGTVARGAPGWNEVARLAASGGRGTVELDGIVIHDLLVMSMSDDECRWRARDVTVAP